MRCPSQRETTARRRLSPSPLPRRRRSPTEIDCLGTAHAIRNQEGTRPGASQRPKKDKAEDYPERAPPPRREVVTSLPPPAGGVSRGRSSHDTNYHGRVAAHLARHKQFPTDARRRGEDGSAIVAFSIDSAGRLTTVV